MTGWAETSWSERADRAPPAAQAALVAALATALAAVLPMGWIEGLVGDLSGPGLLPVDLRDRVFLSVLAGLTIAAAYALVRWLGERRPAREVVDDAADHPLRVEPLAATRDLGPSFDDSPYLASPPPTPDARIDPDSTLADPRWHIPAARPPEPEGWADARTRRETWLDEDADRDSHPMPEENAEAAGTRGDESVEDRAEDSADDQIDDPGEEADRAPSRLTRESASPAGDSEDWGIWVRNTDPVEAVWVEEPEPVTPAAVDRALAIDATQAVDPTSSPPPPATPFDRTSRDAAEPWDGQERRVEHRNDWPASDRRRPTPCSQTGREDPALLTTAELLDRLTRAAERSPDRALRDRSEGSATVGQPAADLQAALDALRRAG